MTESDFSSRRLAKPSSALHSRKTRTCHDRRANRCDRFASYIANRGLGKKKTLKKRKPLGKKKTLGKKKSPREGLGLTLILGQRQRPRQSRLVNRASRQRRIQ